MKKPAFLAEKLYDHGFVFCMFIIVNFRQFKRRSLYVIVTAIVRLTLSVDWNSHQKHEILHEFILLMFWEICCMNLLVKLFLKN